MRRKAWKKKKKRVRKESWEKVPTKERLKNGWDMVKSEKVVGANWPSLQDMLNCEGHSSMLTNQSAITDTWTNQSRNECSKGARNKVGEEKLEQQKQDNIVYLMYLETFQIWHNNAFSRCFGSSIRVAGSQRRHFTVFSATLKI